jgi:toxin-antitoxin system PIN domain toxin
VFVVDANVLLHAVNESSREHAEARDWMVDALEGNETVAFAWTVLLAFLRLSTHPSVFTRPLEPGDAAEILETWLGARTAVVIEPSSRHLALLRGLLSGSGMRGNLVSDAHLAALAIEHDATLVSFDRDFGRFEGLRWRPPGAVGG